jgi:hypothetical protein
VQLYLQIRRSSYLVVGSSWPLLWPSMHSIPSSTFPSWDQCSTMPFLSITGTVNLIIRFRQPITQTPIAKSLLHHFSVNLTCFLRLAA